MVVEPENRRPYVMKEYLTWRRLRRTSLLKVEEVVPPSSDRQAGPGRVGSISRRLRLLLNAPEACPETDIQRYRKS
jgi:hypothetical protein